MATSTAMMGEEAKDAQKATAPAQSADKKTGPEGPVHLYALKAYAAFAMLA
jgi:hypothetical protein